MQFLQPGLITGPFLVIFPFQIIIIGGNHLTDWKIVCCGQITPASSYFGMSLLYHVIGLILYV